MVKSVNTSTASGPSCTDFVYSGCCHFDNGRIVKINDDVLIELSGLVLPLTVYLIFFSGQEEGNILSLFFVICLLDPSFMLKS